MNSSPIQLVKIWLVVGLNLPVLTSVDLQVLVGGLLIGTSISGAGNLNDTIDFDVFGQSIEISKCVTFMQKN